MRSELHRIQHERDLYQETIESMYLNKDDFVEYANIVFVHNWHFFIMQILKI